MWTARSRVLTGLSFGDALHADALRFDTDTVGAAGIFSAISPVSGSTSLLDRLRCRHLHTRAG